MRLPLHVKLLVGGGLGVVLGLGGHALFPDSPTLTWTVRHLSQPTGQLFLRLLFMLVIPLVFSALVLGVTGLGDLRSLGRLGLKTLGYTVVVSTIAALLGVGLVNLLRPGDGMPAEARARLLVGAAERASALSSPPLPKTFTDFLVQIVPDNPVKAAASGEVLAVMFFALMVGIGLARTRTDGARALEKAIQGLYDVTMRLVDFVVSLAPVGVGALLFSLTAQLGFEVLSQLARYVGVVLLGLALHQFVVFSLSVKLLGGMSPLVFFRGIEDAMLTAFSTASSNATLPTALKCAQENLKLPPHVARFVLTIGSTTNQNGTALFEGVTVLFLAQFYGVELSLPSQAVVVGICVLAGIGTAGIPGGSLPVIAAILHLVGVPTEGIGLILGVDRFLDMCRTTLNVTGDLAAAVVVARGEASQPPLSEARAG
jgi:DAACS family dicarboxylate/amino acid:cation (Na+ or H+) symporter